MRARALAALLAAALAVAGAACQFTLLRGSGELLEQTRGLSDFDRLAASHAFEVEVRVGTEPAVTVTSDDNVIDHVTMHVSNGMLQLGLRPGFQVRSATLQAVVTVPGLEEVRASGASEVRLADPLAGERLRVRSSGASEIVGPVDVTELEVAASGASTIRLEGRAGTARLEASGASDLALAGLTVADARVQLSGASDGLVEVDGTLEAQLSGASSLAYTGSPTLTRESVTGASSLEAR